MGKISVVGIGPGDESMMTIQARSVLTKCDTIVGYKAYIDLVRSLFPGKEMIESSMGQERERCRLCISLARSDKSVALICSGDAGIYGMASPMLEECAAADFDEVEIVPGVTSALSGAAMLGAPVGHDLCIISLSDILTPWEVIEKRLRCAAEGDYCIAIYNPASHSRPDHLKRACNILMEILPPDRVCGYARNVGREGSESKICTLSELSGIDADMFTTVFIGNRDTMQAGGRMITKRIYG
ncbi:MAG: precorrin-3B C(17)-methyltransferase [Lachnospiraceae bacterium]|nr:precorrin-3B C(17)-methyltransferase [Lachnospiraceae bacterium]